MKYTTVKEYRPARVVLGVGLYGSAYPAEEGVRVMHYYVEHGGNIIDTGNIYANWIAGAQKSASEKFLGKFFRENPGFRDNIILCSKGAHYSFDDPKHSPRVKPECIRQDLGNSLQNMGVDYIDLYWLHRDDATYPVEPIMDTLFEAQDAGKIRHFGASNWSIARMRAANAYAASCGREGFFGAQLQYSFVRTLDVSDKTTLYFDEQSEADFYLETGMDLFAYTSQAKGYITKLLNNLPFKGNTERNYDCPLNRMRAARAAAVACDIGNCTAEEVALAYLHTRPYNTLTIVGPRTLEQIASSMVAGDLELTPEQIAYLENDRVPFAH